jgi:hypothetical protein
LLIKNINACYSHELCYNFPNIAIWHHYSLALKLTSSTTLISIGVITYSSVLICVLTLVIIHKCTPIPPVHKCCECPSSLLVGHWTSWEVSLSSRAWAIRLQISLLGGREAGANYHLDEPRAQSGGLAVENTLAYNRERGGARGFKGLSLSPLVCADAFNASVHNSAGAVIMGTASPPRNTT